MILIVESNYASTEKENSVFFYRVHTSPNSRFHSYLKSTGSLRFVSALLSPFSFPNRSTTSNFSSLHNSSFTDHFSTTSHQPFPPCKFTFRFFFSFSFLSVLVRSKAYRPSLFSTFHSDRSLDPSFSPSNTFTKVYGA